MAFLSDDSIVGMTADLAKAMAHINELLPQGEKWRQGGFFLCLHLQPGTFPVIRSHVPIGKPLAEKVVRYWGFSLEKGVRLARHPGHQTSQESRNDEAEQYSGAVRANEHIFSFSGLPEEWDEALMLWLALRYQLIIWSDIYAITRMSAAVDGCLRKLLKIEI